MQTNGKREMGRKSKESAIDTKSDALPPILTGMGCRHCEHVKLHTHTHTSTHTDPHTDTYTHKHKHKCSRGEREQTENGLTGTTPALVEMLALRDETGSQDRSKTGKAAHHCDEAGAHDVFVTLRTHRIAFAANRPCRLGRRGTRSEYVPQRLRELTTRRHQQSTHAVAGETRHQPLEAEN